MTVRRRRGPARRDGGVRFGLPLAAVAIGLTTLVIPCEAGILDPAGPIGAAQRTILIDAFAVMSAVAAPTIVATLAFAWWYRSANVRARRRPDFAYSGRVEIVTWSVPLLVIVFLGGIAWVGSHDLDPAKPLAGGEEPLRIQVVSLDWKWLFILPDQDVATVNQLVVPVGRPLAFALTSASVMNTFFVPRLGSMIYTMNGMTTRLHLKADEAGTFEGLSGHFSGDGFPGMRFQVRAVAPADFAGWVAATRGGAATLDAREYGRLARQSANVPPMAYRSAEDGLFDAIVGQVIPPGPGPETGHPTPSISPRSAGICTPARPRGAGAPSALPLTRRGV